MAPNQLPRQADCIFQRQRSREYSCRLPNEKRKMLNPINPPIGAFRHPLACIFGKRQIHGKDGSGALPERFQ